MSTQNEVEEVECAICHDSQTEDGVATQYITTTCNHRFHKKCLEEWFNQSNNTTSPTCPMCRTIVRGFDFTITELYISSRGEIPDNYFTKYPNLKKLTLFCNMLFG